MKNLLEKLANLINVKTVVTFAVTAVFCILALKGSISSDTFMTVAVMVISFYFGTQYEKNANPKKDDKNDNINENEESEEK